MKNIIFIFGTRPEIIKLAPIILEMKKYPEHYNVILCNTEQQKELSNQTLSYFGLKADINLDSMRENQSLSSVQARILTSLDKVFCENKIDASVVQGDTMTVLCGALTSFYNKIPVFHVEAGLRSYDKFEPFPEAFNNDSAFFDRIHAYLPGWETPKLRSSLFTKNYGLISDCFSEFCHAMRKLDDSAEISSRGDKLRFKS